MIDVIDTLEKFDALKDEWERIEQNPDMRIFQTYSWCRNAWDICVSKEKGTRLWILRWHQDGKDDVVIFPFYIDGKGCLRFIMDRHSDVCNAVYDSRNLNRHWVYKEATAAILENKAIKSVFLQKMEGGGEALNYMSVLIPGCVVSRDNAFSWIKSEKTDKFIAAQTQLRRKDRDRLKAILRKTGELRFRICSTENGDEFPAKAIIALRSSMVGKFRHDDSFLNDDMLCFARKIYDAGMSEIPVLENDDGVCALAFRFLKNRRINYWIVLYRNQILTTELYLRYMIDKAKDSAWIFDFGVGAYGYKLGTYRPEVGVTFSLRYAKNAIRNLMCLLEADVRLVKDVLKPRIHK